MECYVSNGMEDIVVPRYEEQEYNIPSPESWSNWEFTSPANFNNESFAAAAAADKPKFKGKLWHDAEFESAAPSTCSSMYGGLSNQSRLQHHLDNQLGDFGRFEQLDDMFLGSLLEDQTWSENLHKSFCFSTEYECEAMEADYLLDDITSNGFGSEGISVEESVLKELETATTQLSDKTRICFRDAFYRLAKNSKQNPVAINQQENLNVQTHSPKWTISEEKIRSGKKRKTESETNTIDRTIANLIFDKMDTNVGDFSVFATPDSENVIQVTGKLSACSSESQSQIHCFSQSYVSTK